MDSCKRAWGTRENLFGAFEPRRSGGFLYILKHWKLTGTSDRYAFGQADSLLGLSEVLLRQARDSEATSFLDEAIQISKQGDYKWARNRSKELLTEVHEAEPSSNEPPAGLRL